MGAVYEVVDTVTNGARALKVMLPSALVDPDMRARFSLEVKVTGAIESEHLARVLDAGVDEASDSPFLVMELLRGEDLGKLVATRGPLPPEEVVTYLRQTALALDKTHAEGIVHRDIKPENLFITTRDDGSPCLKVLDFGIAKITKSGDAQRTRAYPCRIMWLCVRWTRSNASRCHSRSLPRPASRRTGRRHLPGSATVFRRAG